MDYNFSDEEGDWEEEDIFYEKEKQEYIIPEDCKINIKRGEIDLEINIEKITNEIQKKYFKQKIIYINVKEYSKTITVNTGGKLGFLLDYKIKKVDFEDTEYLIIKINNFIKNTIKNLNKKCLICDKDTEYYNYKPDICKSILCYHGYNELNLCSSIREEILRDKQVCDLLISLFVSACASQHPIYNLKISKETAINIINCCPPVNKLYRIAEYTKTEKCFKKLIDKYHSELYNLIKYIIDSCPLYIESIGKFEFKIITSTEKEEKFKNLYEKQEYKKILTGYHGSSISNWHNIIRMGLKNYSGTKQQKNGAAFGNGIYLATTQTFSLFYSIDITNIWKLSEVFSLRKKNRIVAKCDIIDQQKNSFNYNESKWQKTKDIFVVDEEEYVNIKSIKIC